MKSLNYIAAGLLAVSLAGVASAASAVRVSGSSAFRSAAVQAEIAILSFDVTGAAAAPTMATAKTDPTADAYSIIHGWLNDVAHTEVTFINNWTGSAAGVLDLASGNEGLNWVPVDGSGLSTVPMAVSPGTDLRTVVFSFQTGAGTAPSVAFSDVAKTEIVKAVATQGSVGATLGGKITTAGSKLKDGTTAGGPVAAATFKWVIGKNSVGQPFTNITQQQASALINNGSLALNILTGNTADANDFVFFVGRNEDSGTRITYTAESQVTGLFGSPVTQWMLSQTTAGYPASPTYSSLSAELANPINGLKIWPAGWAVNTIPTLAWPGAGHSGYNGGGDVVAVLTTNNPVTGFTKVANPDLPAAWIDGTSKAYFVSCLGTSDAKKVTDGGGFALSYNGVSLTVADRHEATNGIYSLYSLEHCYYLSSKATGIPTEALAPAGIVNALSDYISTETAGQIGAAGVPEPLVGLRNGTGAFIQ